MAKGLKYLLLMLLLGCAPKVTHREVENPSDKFINYADGAKWRCSEKCAKYKGSSRVYFEILILFDHLDFYQCENDSYSICMLDCHNLPATDTTYCYEKVDSDE